MYWRYDLSATLTAELIRKAELRETYAITKNLLECLGMVVKAWVILDLVGDHQSGEGGLVLMPGDNVAAVTWVVKYGGYRENRSPLVMRMLERLEHRWRMKSHRQAQPWQAENTGRWHIAVATARFGSYDQGTN